jgi:ferredoxin-NADP reductase
MDGQAGLNLVVTEVRQETPRIRAIRLARAHGEALPSWDAGGHIKVHLPQGDERSYSLVNFSTELTASTNPRSYLLGVRLEEPSQGGSAYMHALRPGDVVAASPPSNNFRLQATSKPVILLAARQLSIHTDDVSGLFDVAGLMSSLKDDESLYCCGPMPMIEQSIKTAKELGWRDGRLHFEIFTAPQPKAGDQAFEVVLKSTGDSFHVPAGKSILDTLIEAGKDPLYDCKRGDCGICQVGVIEGVPDHRDFILSDSQKAAGDLMQICVSRSKTPRLVLDL